MRVTTAILREWFNEFNTMCFCGKLPMVSFTINRKCTKRLGQYNARTRNIDITNTYDREEKWFKETLIHEMVHHYTWVNFRYCGHKKQFAETANTLNRLYGFHIETYAHLKRDENIEPISRTRAIPKKTSHTLCMVDYKGKTLVCLLSDNFNKESMDWYKERYNVRLFHIDHIPHFMAERKFPICRSRFSGKFLDKGSELFKQIKEFVA